MPFDIYTPISSTYAVIVYAENFVPSWAGAIAIDLLPAVLVLIAAVAQGAIRAGRELIEAEDALTVGELRAALIALKQGEAGDVVLPEPRAPDTVMSSTPRALE